MVLKGWEEGKEDVERRIHQTYLICISLICMNGIFLLLPSLELAFGGGDGGRNTKFKFLPRGHYRKCREIWMRAEGVEV